ncbi:MAG TPA: hypothetical protein VL326_34130 [Kofleriaceae bacterium]|nr:hypothetical protein [Kofleriaceae bacterium]
MRPDHSPSLDQGLAAKGAVLVDGRVLRRVIKLHRKVRSVGLQVPHEHVYTLQRRDLATLVSADELPVPLESLPEDVTLVPTSNTHRARLGSASGGPARVALWRLLFHARVHQALDRKYAFGELSITTVRERVHRVGQTEFDEIRSVLQQEDLLLPPVDPVQTYIEFAALFAELRQFAPDDASRTFPAIRDITRIDEVIALDVNVAEVFKATRPPNAPEPSRVDEAPATPPPTATATIKPRARSAASSARARGNQSRAALLSARAGDVDSARTDLLALGERLGQALGVTADPSWADALLPLVRAAAGERSLRFDPGARLLQDLQLACVNAEQDVEVVDVIGWTISRGRRALVRPLPMTRALRTARRVHSAARRVPACELPTRDARDRLATALNALRAAADAHVRAAYRPVITKALHDVGLIPHTIPERVAEKNVVDQLIDRAVAVGYLSLGDVRDAIASHDLKLPDLQLEDMGRGDPLLRADDQLAQVLDGVYRRGEVYMRGLQRVSSPWFGTTLGRLATLYLLLPFLGSFAIIEGLQHMIAPVAKRLGYEVEIASRPLVLGTAGFLFLILHVPPLRRALWFVLRWFGRGLRFLLIDIPLDVWGHPIMRAIRGSPVVRFVIRPAIPAVIAYVVFGHLGWWRYVIAAGAFAATAVLFELRWVRRTEEIVEDALLRSGRHVAGRLVPGLIRLTLEVFAGLVDRLERAMYRIDLWIRFRRNRSRLLLVPKAILGTIWFFISYFLRLYVNLFVEPTINPIKHFPVVTVAAKIMIPFIPALLSGISALLEPVTGSRFADGFAAFTVLVLPGLAGFLVWELQANWKLYRATRVKTLRPIPIGHHGETISRFLRPGFHSGTIPKLFTKLRRAAWEHDARAAAKAKEALHHVEDPILLFAERQLASMLNEAEAFKANDVTAADVSIGSNRIQLELACPSIAPQPAILRIELQSGWIVAGIAEPGWLTKLDETQREIFQIALAGFYKLAAVDVVREQLEHILAEGTDAPPPPYDFADEGLLVWPGRGFETELLYDFRSRRVRSHIRGAPLTREPLPLRGKHAVFGKEPLYSSVWSTTWQQIARGERPMPIISGPSLLS